MHKMVHTSTIIFKVSVIEAQWIENDQAMMLSVVRYMLMLIYMLLSQNVTKVGCSQAINNDLYTLNLI